MTLSLADGSPVDRITFGPGEHLPGQLRILFQGQSGIGFPVPDESHLGSVVASLFGRHDHGLEIASVEIDEDSLSDHGRQVWSDAVGSVVQQWGNSTIDGAHGIANCLRNRHLLNCPIPKRGATDLPIVAVGAGPSLDACLDDLRSFGGLIIAADAAVKPLLRAGITPDLVTPLERLNSTDWKLPESADATFAGSPFVPAATPSRFRDRWLVPTCDPIFDWFGGLESTFNPGPTTGTHAVALALWLTTGPVYLIGHDCCGGHANGCEVSAALTDPSDLERVDRSGRPVITKAAWLRAHNALEGLVHGRVVIDAQRGHGLPIAGVTPGELPRCVAKPHELTEPPDASASWLFERIVSLIPADLREMRELAAASTSIADCGIPPSANQDLLAYLLRPVIAQCSLMRRFGYDDHLVVRVWRTAIENVLNAAEPAILEAAHA